MGAPRAVERLRVRFAKMHTERMSTFAWDDLRHFLAFARAGSMQSAAIALGVNQSTVQRRIAGLRSVWAAAWSSATLAAIG